MNNFDWLLIGHLIADWLLQTKKQALNKTVAPFLNSQLVSHSFVYTLTFIPMFLIIRVSLFWLILIFSSHCIIDSRKPILWWLKNIKKLNLKELEKRKYLVIVVDQIFHLLILVIIVICTKN